MASIKVILRTNKTLKNGEHPITLRFIKNRKAKFIYTGKSSSKEHWDSNLNLPNRKHPLYKELSIYLKKKVHDVEVEMLTLERENIDYSIETISDIVSNKNSPKDVINYINEIIDELTKNGKIGNSIAYADCKRALLRFLNKKKAELDFSSITPSFLKKFESYLLSSGLKESSVSVYMRTLRAVFNRAIQDKLVKKDLYPFNEYKISKLSTQPNHRALEKDKLNFLLEFQPNVDSSEFHSHNFFVFSYYCWGINLMDIGLLKWKNIQNNRLVYVRAKTGKLYNIPLLAPAQWIVDFYKNNQQSIDKEEYIFPILNAKIHVSPKQIKYRTQKINKRTNKDLQAIAKKLGIEEKITTYVARHSFATNLRDLDVSTSKIQHMLGHVSERTTQGYLDSFKNNELDEAAKLLL
ncbi:MAG: phage integrase SAM-like domain-containing protein [bacterium]